MSSTSHNVALLDLEPDTIIELYEIDLGEIYGLIRLHPGKNNLKNIYLRDNNGVLQEYSPIPLEAKDFEVKGDGGLARPKILLANPQGVISDVIKTQSDLIGNFFVRKRIFLKFLDAENFPNFLNPFGAPDPNSRFEDDIFIINRKLQENKYFVEYELVTPLELEGIKVPARQMIADYCPWRYRGEGCFYGDRLDYTNQKVRLANNVTVSPETFFQNEARNTDGSVMVNTGPNLGIPIADINNKLFSDPFDYNLTLNWAGKYNSQAVVVEVNSVSTITKFEVTIDNADGYSIPQGQFSSNITITVDAISDNIGEGKIIKFANGAIFTLTSAASGGATTLTGTLTLNNLVDDEVGHAPQSIPIVQSAESDFISRDRTIIFSGGISLKLDDDLNFPPVTTASSTLSGYLSGNLNGDEEGSLYYVPGDVVSITRKVENLSKIRSANTQQFPDNNPDRFFVCVKQAAVNLDPRFDQEYWRADECNKNLRACKCRYELYGEYQNGLPFGGFPSIERYSF